MSQGSISTALKVNEELSAEVQNEIEELELAEEAVDAETSADPVKPGAGKLIVAEEISEGHVSWAACKFSLASMSCRA